MLILLINCLKGVRETCIKPPLLLNCGGIILWGGLYILRVEMYVRFLLLIFKHLMNVFLTNFTFIGFILSCIKSKSTNMSIHD